MNPPLYRLGESVVRSNAKQGLRFIGKVVQILSPDEAAETLEHDELKNFYWKDFENRDSFFRDSPMYLVESNNYGFATWEEASHIVPGISLYQYQFLGDLTVDQIERLFGMRPKTFLCLESDLLPGKGNEICPYT
jgi:hypothetical protein